MKTQLQVLSLLNQYTPATDLDRDMITAFLEKNYHITPTTPIFAPQATETSIDVQSFLQWYKVGYGASEVAKTANNNKLVILGNSTLSQTTIIGTLQNETIVASSQLVENSELEKATPEEAQRFLHALLYAKLQLNPMTMKLEPKYFPTAGEKVFYHSWNFETNGIGIVRGYNPEKPLEIELYCYFAYPTKTVRGRLGYSMHESDVVNLRDYIFEPLLESPDCNNSRFSSDDGISAYRRLKRELEKVGKLWRDKLHRIEPLDYRLAKGAPYWYIDDKLRVVKTEEKGTPTSNKRYLCGNYFVSIEAASTMLNKIYTLVNDYLASPDWPHIDED